MRALVLHEWGGPLQLEVRPVPVPGPGEVLVEVAACGVGDTLNNLRDGRNATMPGVGLPRVIGHEVAGTVAETGPGVDTAIVGARVAVYMYLTCGRCRACRYGHDPLCQDLTGHVGMARDGGLADYLVVPTANVLPMPDDLDMVAGCIAVDAVATPWHALSGATPLRPTDTLVVIGAGGGVGIHAVQIGRLMGATVVAADVTADKLTLARDKGATHVVDVRSHDLAAAVADLTHGDGADVVLDYVTTSDTIHGAFSALGPRGTLVIQGVNPPGTRLDIEPRAFVHGEVVVRGSRYASRTEVLEALDLVGRGVVDAVVGHTVPIEETEELFRMIADRELLGRGAVVVGDGERPGT